MVINYIKGKFFWNDECVGTWDDAGSTMLFPGEHALVLSRGHGPTLTLHVTVQCGQPLVIETLF